MENSFLQFSDTFENEFETLDQRVSNFDLYLEFQQLLKQNLEENVSSTNTVFSDDFQPLSENTSFVSDFETNVETQHLLSDLESYLDTQPLHENSTTLFSELKTCLETQPLEDITALLPDLESYLETQTPSDTSLFSDLETAVEITDSETDMGHETNSVLSNTNSEIDVETTDVGVESDSVLTNIYPEIEISKIKSYPKKSRMILNALEIDDFLYSIKIINPKPPSKKHPLRKLESKRIYEKVRRKKLKELYQRLRFLFSDDSSLKIREILSGAKDCVLNLQDTEKDLVTLKRSLEQKNKHLTKRLNRILADSSFKETSFPAKTHYVHKIKRARYVKHRGAV